MEKAHLGWAAASCQSHELCDFKKKKESCIAVNSHSQGSSLCVNSELTWELASLFHRFPMPQAILLLLESSLFFFKLPYSEKGIFFEGFCRISLKNRKSVICIFLCMLTDTKKEKKEEKKSFTLFFG